MPTKPNSPSASSSSLLLSDLNNEAIALLKTGQCGAAFSKWSQALQGGMTDGLLSRQVGASSSDAATPQQPRMMQSVDVHPDHVAQLSMQACPDVSFPLFCKVFTVGETVEDSLTTTTTTTRALHSSAASTDAIPAPPATATSVEEDAARTSASTEAATATTRLPPPPSTFLNSAIVLYNLGFAYHLCGLSGPAKTRASRLQQANRVYGMAEEALSQGGFFLSCFDKKGNDGESRVEDARILLLSLGLFVNKGHVHAFFLETAQVNHCKSNIAALCHTLRRNDRWSQLSLDDQRYVLSLGLVLETTTATTSLSASVA